MDLCVAYLRDLGLDPHEDPPPLAGRSGGQRHLPHPGDGRRDGHADHVLRPRRHGASRRRRSSRWCPTASSRTRATTILGGDNKAAVASMLEGVRRVVAESRPHAGIELMLSVQEEIGLLGVKALDCSQLARAHRLRLRPRRADRRDRHTRCPSQYSVDATFHGPQRTPASRPSRAAARSRPRRRAIAEMRFGRLDDETTANVGSDPGGTARNVVPERCDCGLEVRSRDHERARKESQAMLDAMAHAANVEECELETAVDARVRGVQLRRSRSRRADRWAALESCGYTPELLATGGGADAHVFNATAYPASNLGQRHGEHPHRARSASRWPTSRGWST